MSLVSDFVTTVSSNAFDVIGGESVTIGGGTAVTGILDEVTDSREFSEIGFEPSTTINAVIRKSAWTAAGYSSTGATYVGKLATARTLTFRVERCSVDGSFVRIALKKPDSA